MPRPDAALWRLARVFVHLVWAVLFLAAGGKNKEAFRQSWSRGLLAILGIRLELRDREIPGGTVLVANHVSWLDVMVLNVLCPADFVAKAEIRDWPLFGWLLERNDALFLDRRIGRHLLRLNSEIARRLARGRVVAFFPEGTTTDGSIAQPFRHALFEPAVKGAHAVQPCAISYRDLSGRRCEAAAFIGRQSFLRSLLNIALQPGMVASVRVCAPLAPAGLSRREAARLAHDLVQEGLPRSEIARASSTPSFALPISGHLQRGG